MVPAYWFNLCRSCKRRRSHTRKICSCQTVKRTWPLDNSGAVTAFLAVGKKPAWFRRCFPRHYYINWLWIRKRRFVTGITPSIIAVGNLAKGDLTLQFDEPLLFSVLASGDAQDTKGVDLGSVQAPGRLKRFHQCSKYV